ncbi:hydantoinase/oxoprolinase family protein [Methanococcoides orientis]|uniref:hydantoinase/oxoprolinase family protein n=1 Tax=Methanococcoides orientis TaxID=2822137 RepID=UPI001E5B7CE3|nr:hydantoinase/oxoprolinase family protein [Methanococcoides orientis]UGV41639.1 hydantoinase/oxoprolinase family protein [Methanococcoides orientis]
MKYSLGIDAGGTYTDAVLISDADGKIIDSTKARTTYPDLLPGIQNAFDGLDQSILKQVKLVSVSTTLATNTILEKTGYPVGLILVGKTDTPKNSAIKYYISVNGGHSSGGNEVEPLDLDSVEEFVEAVKNKVSAFAVSSYFSVRNPEHELKVKEIITELTGMPVICGHELSQSLGAYDRGITAFLNAQLLPIANQFMKTVASEVERRGINAKLMMLKCDGSIVGMNEALKHPIESIFTGPAASLVGAAYLSKEPSCVVIDVGGTSTDVSLTVNGLPQISDTGAIVGGWQTKVEAIKMETSAMGGDSHVWVMNHVLSIGPRRVVPLCVAATKYPRIIKKLKQGQSISRLKLGENVQPTKFFVRTEQKPIELTKREEELLNRIGDEPLAVSEIYLERRILPSPMLLDSLIQKRLIQTIGFTPTDALHVLGDYNEWNTEASILGAEQMCIFADMEVKELCLEIKKKVAKNMALNLLSYLMETVDAKEIEKGLDGDFFAGFKADVPVVLLGGPVRAYTEEIKKFVDAKILLPEHAEVGNAVGALAGKGVKRIEILIRVTFGESKYNLKPTSISVFSPLGKDEMSNYDEAVVYAEELGNKLVMDYMQDAELEDGNINIEVTKKVINPLNTGVPLETKYAFLGIAELKK